MSLLTDQWIDFVIHTMVSIKCGHFVGSDNDTLPGVEIFDLFTCQRTPVYENHAQIESALLKTPKSCQFTPPLYGLSI
jgi:hypothetical protein